MTRLLTILLLAALLLTACANPNPPIDDATTAASTGEESSTPADNDTTLPEDTDTTVPEDTDTTVPGDTDTTVPEDTDTTVPDDTDTTVPDDTETTVPVDQDTEPPTYNERYAEFLKQYGYSSIDEFENNRYGKPLYPTMGSASDIYVGMTLKELCEVAFPSSLWVWHGYILGEPYFYYLIDKDGNGVIVAFNPDDTVREFKVFQDLKTDVTEEEFLQVTPGMHLYDAVELIGFPRYDSVTGNAPITWGKRMFVLSIDWETLIVESNHYAGWLEYQEQHETTTPEDSETTTPGEIETEPPTYEERFAEVLKGYGYASIADFISNSPGKPLHPLNVSVDDVYVGMPLIEFENLICFLDLIVYEAGSPFWFYWLDKDQNYVITVFDGGDGDLYAHTVREIKVFKNVKEDVTKEEILLITPGMHLYDVIEAVGFPRYNSMYGNRATGFGSARYELVFDTDTMTLKINVPLLRQEYESTQSTTEATDLENSTTEPTLIE